METIRYHQGMIFKFKKLGEEFVHTLCDGELLYKMDLSPEKVIGKRLEDFLPAEQAERKLQYYRAAWAGNPHVVYEGGHKGTHYLAALRPIRRGGEVVEVIGSSIDITDRKRMEEALRLSQLKYRLMVENAENVIVVLDFEGIILYASPFHERFSGYRSQDYEGSSLYNWIHPDDMSDIFQRYGQVVEEHVSQRWRLRYRHMDNGWIDMMVQVYPVENSSGPLGCFLLERVAENV